jgi:hypothetical protein
MLARISIELQGAQAALLVSGLLIVGFGLFIALRWIERSRDRFSQLLEAESVSCDGGISGEWVTEYTSPVLLGVPQACVRFKVVETDEGLFLWKHRSLAGGTRTGIAFLPRSRYEITRQYGHLDVRKKENQSNKSAHPTAGNVLL